LSSEKKSFRQQQCQHIATIDARLEV